MADATVFAGFKVAETVFDLSVPVSIARTAGGDVIPASVGASLWQGSLRLVLGYHADQAAAEARIARLMRAGERFLLHDVRLNGPRLDPGGVILGAATPTVHSVGTTWVRIQGLPAGYTLRAGDMIGWTYGSSPVRRALHRVWTDSIAANGSGLTGQIEVEPLIRPGTTVGAAVTLVRPTLTAILTGATFGAGRPLITDGATLNWIQTLR